MQSISIGYGNANFATRSVKIMALSLDQPFNTVFASKKHKRLSFHQTQVGRTDVEGKLFSETIEVPDNSLILIQVSNNYRGRRVADGAVILRARANAALIQLTSLIPHDAERSVLADHNFNCFMGRADILSAQEATDMYGIEFRRGWIDQYMDTDEIEECFSGFKELAPEIEAAPIVEIVKTVSGSKIAITTPKLRRKVRFRPKD